MQVSSRALKDLLGDWRAAPGPAHRNLADQLRILVLDGRLPLDSTMPGERDLSAALGVSRTTVATAYATVRDQGYLTSRSRSRSRTTVPAAATRGSAAEIDRDDPVIDLSFASPPAPSEALHHAYLFALSQLPRHLTHHGYGAAGLPELRERLAQQYTDRGVPTSADEIMVTGGAQQALALVVRALLRPRARVVVDHPTYPHALGLLASAGSRLARPTPVQAALDLSLSAVDGIME